MNNRTRISALAITIGLFASACSANTSEVDSAQAQIDELQEQIEELNAETEQAQATTAAPTTTTVAEPIIEEPATKDTELETVAPETTVAPEPEPVVEESAPAADTVSVEGFAVADGTALNSTMGPNEVDFLLTDIAGPTTNAAGQFARIAPFPNITTLPDTVIEGVSLNVYLETRSDDLSDQHYNYEVEFTTTALPADVVVAYQAQFAAVGNTSSSSGIETDGDDDVHWAIAGDYQIVARETRAVTTVTIKHTPANAPITAEQLAQLRGLSTSLAVSDTAQVDQVTLFRLWGDNSMFVNFAVEDTTEPEMVALVEQWTSNADWTIDREISDTFIEFVSPAFDGAVLSTSVIELSDWVQTQVRYDYR